LLEAFSERGIGRDDVVIALGGGVVGDLAGFCAATYARGIGLVQVPTTLLAQVDSSIGGKTGVDLPRGKNLVGAFWPPLAVITDTTCLESLPEAEWASGLAEVAKSAILDGESSFGTLSRDSAALAGRDASAVDRAVLMAAALKVRIVSDDERESGAREALNLGHTLGHAIEQVAGYGVVAHGVAVAEGIRFAARLAEEVLRVDPGWAAEQDRLLEGLGLVRGGCAYAPAEILSAMRADKKARGGEIRFVMSTGPGEWQVRPVTDAVLMAGLDKWCDG
jgi:3-dehydroquinate synthase